MYLRYSNIRVLNCETNTTWKISFANGSSLRLVGALSAPAPLPQWLHIPRHTQQQNSYNVPALRTAQKESLDDEEFMKAKEHLEMELQQQLQILHGKSDS